MDEEILNLRLNTVDDAIAFFKFLDEGRARGRLYPPVHHIFFARIDGGFQFQPYLITAINKENRPMNYYILTRQNIVHVNRVSCTYETIGSVEQWRRESEQFDKLRRIRFFKDYLKLKVILRWLRHIRETKFRRNRLLVSKLLLFTHSKFGKSVSSIFKNSSELWFQQIQRRVSPPVESLCISMEKTVPQLGDELLKQTIIRKTRLDTLNLEPSRGFSSDEFINVQQRYSKELRSYTATVLFGILKPIIEQVKSVESDLAYMPPLPARESVAGVANQEKVAQHFKMVAMQRKAAIVAYENRGHLVRLAHHVQIQSLYKQSLYTLTELARAIDNVRKLGSSSSVVWQFRVEVTTTAEGLTLRPTANELLDMAKSSIYEALNTLSNIPTCVGSSEISVNNERSTVGLSLAERVSTLSAILHNDDQVYEHLKSVLLVIERDFADAMQKINFYESLYSSTRFLMEWVEIDQRWTEVIDRVSEVSKPVSGAELRTVVTRSLKLSHDINRLTGRSFGMIHVVCTRAVEEADTRLKQVIKRVEHTLRTLTERQYTLLSGELEGWKSRLRSPELVLNHYCNWVKEIDAADDEYEEFVKRVIDLQGLYHLRVELMNRTSMTALNSDDEDDGDDHHPHHEGGETMIATDSTRKVNGEPDLSSSLRDPFQKLIAGAKEFHNFNISTMKEIVVREHDKIISAIKGAQTRLQTSFGNKKVNDIDSGGSTALEKIKKMEESVRKQRQEAKQLDAYSEMLDFPPLQWTEIGLFEASLLKYKDLWEAVDEQKRLSRKLQNTPVHEFSATELKDTIVSLFQRSFKLSKIIPGEVSEELVSELTGAKAKVGIYAEVCHPALKDDHWGEIFRSAKKQPLLSATRTIKALSDLGIFDNQECVKTINRVVSEAVGVYELEEQMKKLDKYWAERQFKISPYAGRPNFFVIDAVDEVLEELEEQQVLVQTCLASKHVTKIRDVVENWEAKLNLIRAVLLEWISVQKAWMYLEFIFSSDDIKRQLPDESLLFSSADRFFTTLMKKCASEPNIASMCLENDTLSKLEKSLYQLECIQKKLDEYLETKRVAFPRFYFLSNDELLSILSDSRNPLAVQPHLQKCFDNIKELVFSDSKIIVAMKSSEGEVVKFVKEIKIFGNVENWLNDVERAMRETLYASMADCIAAYTIKDRTKWFFDFPSQCVSTTDQIVWTGEVEEVISKTSEGSREAWKDYITFYKQQLLDTVDLVRAGLTSLQRTTVANLIIADVHCRDVCVPLAEKYCSSLVDFDWQKQLRFYWTVPSSEVTAKDCVARHGAAQLPYGYEYLGNQPRLVITPLTERAFLTCTAALHVQKGAAPQGPAGTGKTESVKDLGKALARQVVVFNCSEGLNYKMMSQMFAGLAQGGAWACFDEFNRIELEVLSVIAQQMLDITTAIANRQVSLLFEGHRIRLHPSFGVFITMNPGYAGRTELPDNLKALFRPICMMIPNYALIAEIMFYSEGYADARSLAEKMVHLYSLASQQLSKQDHYDFGMRAVKAILVLAGRLKRADPDINEEILLVRAIRDANLPKFLVEDKQLFLSLLQDFFPSVKSVSPSSVHLLLEAEVGRNLVEQRWQGTPGMIGKSLQLFDTLTTRHGLMLVGPTMTGKSSLMKILSMSLTTLGRRPAELKACGERYLPYFVKTKNVTINPKSITMNELYGDVNPLTREWQDGIFSFTVRDLVKEAASTAESSGFRNRHWVVFDGPVDALWIENLNTVLDDSKILCLVNGERLRIPETISLLFEVQDLKAASPATVSRCGMVYVDEETLGDGWTPVLQSLSSESASELPTLWHHPRFMHLCELLLPPLFEVKEKSCKEYIKTLKVQLARQLFFLMKSAIIQLRDSYDNASSGPVEGESRLQGAEQRRSSVRRRASTLALSEIIFDALFIQSCVWGIGGNLADGYRQPFAQCMHHLLREHDLFFPLAEAEAAGLTVYDYSVDASRTTWTKWTDLVPQFRFDAGLSFFDLVVPTEHTVILNFLLGSAARVHHHILLNGLTGTAKSSTVNNFLLSVLKTEDSSSYYTAFSYSLSAQTTSNNLQETIESKMTKRKADRELGPPVGKESLIIVIDDCNVPQLEQYGAAPPIELLRQVVTQGGFYDRRKLSFKDVVQTMFIACCGEPGGGKNELTPRFTSKLLNFCVQQLSQSAMKTIYTSILKGFFEAYQFNADVVHCAGEAIESTLEAYRRISIECLPTPEKTHCTFNLRDVSKVVQGLVQVRPKNCSTKAQLVRLWSHEASRVFHDRLVDDTDRNWWWKSSDEVIRKHFGANWAQSPENGSAKSEESESGSQSQQRDVGEESTKDTEKDKGDSSSATPGDHAESDTDWRSIMFGNWGSQSDRDYREIESSPSTQETVYQYLSDYNLQSTTPMNLVLFYEAVQHLSRICRIINQPRGHALLVGVGGSGRTSLCRLAASMMNMDLQTVTIVRGYCMEDFKDDLRRALLDSGARNKEVVFVMSDPQLIFSQMLEDINNILNIGEVPGLMRLEDMEVIMRQCREACVSSGRPDTRSSIYRYFVSRCRERCHLVLCMSPMSTSFRERLRMFPSLVNCTTIDWFSQWPEDALLAVASSVLQNNVSGRRRSSSVRADRENENMVEKISQLMVHIHATVKQASTQLLSNQHRHNHTTPTSYLTALSLYHHFLAERKEYIDSNLQRYRTGLYKLDESNKTIGVLKKQISDMQPALAEAARMAEEQRNHVLREQKEADVLKAEQTEEEMAAQKLMDEAEGIRKECEEGLQEAMPALEAAERALETLSAKDIQEIKTFTTPPGNVEKTMNAVLILLKEKEGWASAKSCLGKLDFLSRLMEYPRDEIPPPVIRKLSTYISDPEFIPEVIEKTSLACRSMCMWAHAMYKYYFVAKEVAPKRERLRTAEQKVEEARATLEAKRAALQVVLDKIAALEQSAKEAQAKSDHLNRQIETAKARLQRSDQLIHGLASERKRWEESLKTLDAQSLCVTGTSALGAGCVAYLGPFPADYRENLMNDWKEKCQGLGIPFDSDFALERMLPEAVIQQWALQSLPRDMFSVQNATILQKSSRWCYMIDPQCQANTFIRKKESGTGYGLLVLKENSENIMRSIENAIQVGQPVLLEGVGETLDSALDPILLKQVRRSGGRNVIMLGDKEVPYDDNFKLYLTTTLPNPHLTPETQVKVTMINFTVTREGLEEQLLADIVGTERSELQTKSDRCVVSIAANRDQKRALEERVLRMLNEATGELLDNVELIDALTTSRVTSEKISEELTLAEATNVTISAMRELYRPLATRGSLIYNVITDLARVDPMYEYSLQFFKGLVVSVLKRVRRRSRRSVVSNDDPNQVEDAEGSSGNPPTTADCEEMISESDPEDREDETGFSEAAVTAHVTFLSEEVMWTSYRVVCRGLFERHKLLFSFLLSTTILLHSGRITLHEWDLFVRGGVGRSLPERFEDETLRPSYLSAVSWMDFGALCGESTFTPLGDHFFSHSEEWQTWCSRTFGAEVLSKKPNPLEVLSLWHQLMIIKTIRADKLHEMVKLFVASNLGERYTRAPPFSIAEAYRDSTKLTPLIFVLSPGTDPTALFCSFAEEMGFGDRKYMLSLGQDQGPRAKKMIEDGKREGCWVYLQNCHVYASWMSQLQQLVESVDPNTTHENYRLWLSSSPSPSFPVAILQAGMKLTREPPLGMKGKVRDTLSNATVVEAFESSVKQAENGTNSSSVQSLDDVNESPLGTKCFFSERWKRLVLTLAFFHCIVLERRQFCPLGWNIPYDWGGADFAAGVATITTAVSRYSDDDPIPWEELSFMIGSVDYGGRVTDLWDTRCLEVLAAKFFSPQSEDHNQFSSESTATAPTSERRISFSKIVLPPLTSYDSLLQYIEDTIPDSAPPDVLGLHGNAKISGDYRESALLVQCLVNVNAGGGVSSTHGGATSSDGGGSSSGDSNTEDENAVAHIARDLFDRLPERIPRSAVRLIDASTVSSRTELASAPLETVLSHEIDLYNRLLVSIRASLSELLRALKGEVVVTKSLELMAQRLSYNQVPDLWQPVSYLSLKPLGSYFVDLLKRIQFISHWREHGPPPSFWLPGLFFPQGFVTAILQSRSRSLDVPIDSLFYDFHPLSPSEGEEAMKTYKPGLVGVYVHGLYLDGCGWDFSSESGGLVEGRPGELTVELPVIHFEPTEKAIKAIGEENKSTQNIIKYDCPLYKVSSRAGTLSTTGVSTNYIVTLKLPSLNSVSGDIWTVRGVAALCSLDA